MQLFAAPFIVMFAENRLQHIVLMCCGLLFSVWLYGGLCVQNFITGRKCDMKKTRSISLLLALALLLSILPTGVFAANGTLSGEGTETSPYLIEDAADLKAFRDMVNAEASSTKCAKLVKDIDLENEEWTPFEPPKYVTEAYGGTFDGDFFTIKNLKIDSSKTSGIGLFGTAGNGATIQNLKVEGSVKGTKSAFVGGIVGRAQNGVTVKNCSFRGNVTGEKSGASNGFGGIVGKVNKGLLTLENCANFATVSTTQGLAGGILGYSSQKVIIKDCYNAGAVSAKWYPSGICAYSTNTASELKNCYNIGTVTAVGDGTYYAGVAANFKGTAQSNYYLLPEEESKANGCTVDAEKITSADGLLAKLGGAFAEDKNGINGGYPVLSWQNSQQVVKNPHIEITEGDSALYLSNLSTAPVQTTLKAAYVDMEDTPAISWSVTGAADVVELSEPVDADANHTTVIVTAKKAGKTTIAASAEGVQDAVFTVSVMPYLTTVSLNRSTLHAAEFAAGRTAEANVFTYTDSSESEYDYENFPALNYQWQYRDSAFAVSYENISGATDRLYTVDEAYVGKLLRCVVTMGREVRESNEISIVSAEDGILLDDAEALTLDVKTIKQAQTIALARSTQNGTLIAWTSNNDAIINAETGEVILPSEGTVDVTLTAKLSRNEKYKIRTFTIKVYSQKAAEEEKNNKLLKLENIRKEFGDFYTMYPVFGTDKNITEMFCTALEGKTSENVEVVLAKRERVTEGADISEDGTITYFVTDPEKNPSQHFANYRVTFTLKLEEASLDFEVPVVIGWDRDKAADLLETEIMKSEAMNRVKTETSEPLTQDISLPKTVNGKKWALISWKASNSSIVISSQNQTTAATLFDPYVGVLKRSAEPQEVVLTATATFQMSDDSNPIIVNRVYTATVSAIDADTAAAEQTKLAKALDNGFSKLGLRDAVTGERLTEENGVYTAVNDILFPTTRDFSSKEFVVDGSRTPIRIESSNQDAVRTFDVNNVARAEVLRSASGETREAEITVSITSENYNITAEKKFKISIPALSREELDSEIALMESVKKEYTAGILGDNSSADNVSRNLSPFMEVYENNGKLVWVRNQAGLVNHGIVPVAMDGWQELEAWRLFRSSHPAVISHENLLVTMQNKAKEVTVSSALSSETLGRYGELYFADPIQYAEYSEIAEKLYYQKVSAAFAVRGTSTKKGAAPQPEKETINVTFRLQGLNGVSIAKTSYRNLEETSTAYDVFAKALEDNNFSCEKIGSYVKSIQSADGTKLAEGDAGEKSGWMYKVNGEIPEVALGAYGLSDGDDVLVFFTKDYSKEDYSHSSGKDESKQNGNKNKDKNTGSGSVGTDISALPYRDIDGHWAAESIGYMCDKNLMKGVSDMEFAPEAVLTRAMLVTILYRMAQEPLTVNSAAFTDVGTDTWYSAAVAWASENNIVSGISDTEFAPDSNITREQIAAMLMRYAAFRGIDTGKRADTSAFMDAEMASDWSKDALAWAIGEGLLSGRSVTELAPRGAATRAEIATILTRFLVNVAA